MRIYSRKITTVSSARRSKFAMAGFIASLAFHVVACAAPEKTRWTKPGTNAGPKPTDATSCRADAKRYRQRIFGQCLRSLGYEPEARDRFEAR